MLLVPEVGVETVGLREKLLVGSLLADLSVLQNQDSVRVYDGGETVSYDQSCPALRRVPQGFQYVLQNSGSRQLKI